jgi:hypothetical protein
MLGKALLSASVSASAAPAVYVEDVFSTYLYTGNDSTQTITNGIDLAGEGGLVWLKNRSVTSSHQARSLSDTLRGCKARSPFRPGASAAVSRRPPAADVESFTSTGFVAGGSVGSGEAGHNWASWTFRKAPRFFDVVTWSGNNTNNREIPHNLGSAPGCIIVKNTTEATAWYVWHRSLPPSGSSAANLRLNTTDAVDYSDYYVTDNSTSEYIKLGLAGGLNETGRTYVAYLFAHDAGGFGDAGADNVISCGSYTGNGSADGPEIDLGWEPQWVMFRRATGVEDWIMFDNMRGMVVGGIDPDLRPNQSQAEGAFVNYLEPNATGFKLTDANSRTNENGDTYIYIAIRRGPMRAPESGTEVFSANTYSGGTAGRSFSLGFVPDALLTMRRNTSNFGILQSRLTSGYMFTYDTGAESVASTGIPVWDADTGTLKLKTASSVTGWNASGSDYVNEVFRRAPGFFDVVCTEGSGATPPNT